jgi:hypothetical protein
MIRYYSRGGVISLFPLSALIFSLRRTASAFFFFFSLADPSPDAKDALLTRLGPCKIQSSA